MKMYTVKFNCLMPCEIITVIEAETEEIAKLKIINNEFEGFRYKTSGKLYDIQDITLEKIE